MQAHLDPLRHVPGHGAGKSDRAGAGTRSVSGWPLRFELNAGFAWSTTENLRLRSIPAWRRG